MTTADFGFSHDNVYGNALSLLEAHPTTASSGAEERLHLDIGCGRAPLAAPVTAALGRTYVGTDVSQDVVDDVRARGFEAHRVELAGREETAAALREVIGDRRLASISVLDVLQLMPQGQTALAGIRDVALEHDAVVVVSVPNVTHADVGFKLAFGRWDVTESGILGRYGAQHFDKARLDRELRRSGLYRFAARDVVAEVSDQHFPVDHPALQRGTSLHGLLMSVRAGSSPDALVNQFVWLCAPGPIAQEDFVLTRREESDRPFLSVVMRTQGKRLECLEEALTCMAGQSSTDFEVLVMGHRLSLDAQLGVERVIEDCPTWLRDRVRLVKVERGRRAAPLNEGFAAARGHYIAILDDDDIPFGHWVETFKELAEQAPGRVLRTVSAQQDVVVAEVLGARGVRAVGSIEDRYPASFDFIDHLRQNYTPNTAIAFPRGAFHDLGIHFDESLTTTEDWDFIMRTVSVVGVASSPKITCLYHWWVTGQSSRTDHDTGEWERNQAAILRKFDESPLLLPAGAAARVRALLTEVDQLRWSLDHEAQMGHGSVAVDQARMDALRRIQEILESRSWRATAPLRLAGRASGRGTRIRVSDYYGYPYPELLKVIDGLLTSRSWRAARRLRR
ncbi:glycosyltransferase family 2 protein [Cellulomonas fengjieae]|uniref:glycosyltransferase family 2 protein n=1 Tax=Cellulomonas fengjieae TaxID=2819978 RepID=UPI001AAFCD8F|nr:glycosyltransferase family A protein [Cellulomonas fengjieae]MBO3101392.1 glycosyltransferase [Cellulomonas fengjieae]